METMWQNKVEKWRDIVGWEGIYQISNCGRLKSFKKACEGYLISNKNKNGDYFAVVLSAKHKKIKSTRMHRLVAIAFIPNPFNKPQINHKDGNKQNNNVFNLEWCTAAENMQHALALGLHSFKEMNYYNKHIRSKMIQQYTLNNQFMNEYINCKEASKVTGVCARNIHQVAKKTEYKTGMTRSQAGGFKWRFKNATN